MPVSLISPQAAVSIIKSLTEAALVTSSSVVAIATTAVPEAPRISAPSASESSSSRSSVRALTELLLLQLWELCGYSQLPTATILPVVLLDDPAGAEKGVTKRVIHFHQFYL